VNIFELKFFYLFEIQIALVSEEKTILLRHLTGKDGENSFNHENISKRLRNIVEI
jgi:hypothetical protein